MKMKSRVFAVLGGVVAVGGLTVAPALASASHGYGSQPGYDVANSQTACAGHGSFGAFGSQGSIVHDFGVNNLGSNDKPGASNWQFPSSTGGTTAANNSGLCGNQATPPPFTNP